MIKFHVAYMNNWVGQHLIFFGYLVLFEIILLFIHKDGNAQLDIFFLLKKEEKNSFVCCENLL